MSQIPNPLDEKRPLVWPPEVLASLGTWDDVPELEALRANDPPDSHREDWD